MPGDRKVHSQPMVRLGGVAIFSGVLVALLVVWFTGGFLGADGLPLDPVTDHSIWGVTLGGVAFFAIGLLDDLFGLSAISRLIMQIIVASMAWYVGVDIAFLNLPWSETGITQLPDVISWVVTIFWLVGMANAINWIDGLDGLAAGVSGIAAVVMTVVALYMQQPAAALVAAALAGASLSFLRYNFNPAQIFMGDGGAYFIGFTLAGVGIIGLVKGVTTVAVLLPSLTLAIPILDMSTVIVLRLRKGLSPFVADKRHLHHRLLKAGFSHRFTVLFIYALALWVGSLAMAFSGLRAGIPFVLASTALLSYTGWRAIHHAR
ncbi:MAG: UDP-GlcNAc:undecaprenyl-phosphate GlcNAc-1-phosphate transferase [Phormidesmis priestleyi Ana]|uniref:UDP-GlcNAc:undecaprenyl-phosphate GlcNAc-1-phosphate transferase n=1 Tax=Phormidesmis priestleyi Ana TaxID=1666911 RepID=A0A0P7ZZ05_9CYAN|nr:MAG: UDP-GlcNAc:undecaprenyl-phosphate GlcNAc-1-phosphate transferase [Phormidesmis priestleyi Ana]